jgi:non-ribosomal peptide synthetase component E (peptide arylation enzyme)
VPVLSGPDDPDEKLAHTEGRPCPPEAVLRIVGADGSDRGPGEEGEIRAKAPQQCTGCLDSALDAAAFDDQGFFRTGDLGALDADGFLTITGRLKDVIIRKGENISAKELEDLLYRHPKVEDVAVIGLPDPDTGERACAVVVSAGAGNPVTLGEIAGFLKAEGLMLQKLPERLEFIDELPRNPTGKVLKHELRQRFE